jgi:hypothetical protein
MLTQHLMTHSSSNSSGSSDALSEQLDFGGIKNIEVSRRQ